MIGPVMAGLYDAVFRDVRDARIGSEVVEALIGDNRGIAPKGVAIHVADNR
jgi:hypothetical protein